MDPESTYQIEQLNSPAQLDALEKEWTELIAGIPSVPIFLAWEWIRTWWLFFGQGRCLWLLTARDNQGVLVGIAPWMSEVQKIGLLKIRTIAFIGINLVSPIHMNILARPADQQRLSQAFMDFLLRQPDRWDAISFEALAQESTLNSLAAVKGAWVGNKVTSLYITFPGSWDIYSKTLTKKLRRNLKYFRSKLEGDHPGNVCFTCVSDPGEIEITMRKLEKLSRARLHDQGLNSAFDDPQFCDFNVAIAHLALSRGWLRLYKLTVEEQIIAIFYCFHFQDHVYAYQIVFDLDWKSYSPGRLLIAHGIQSAIEERACELDWLAGAHDYKLAWTDKMREEYQILLGGSWRGHLWVKGKNYREVIKAKVKQALPQSAQLRIKQLLSSRQGTSERSEVDGDGANPTD